jgi:exodeoxyribonuclease VII small subunit
MTKSAKPINYETLRTELDQVLSDLQSDTGNVDQSIKQYKRGLELIQQLEQYLQTAENDIQELKAKFSRQP